MDRLLARLERRFGRYAVHGLTWYLILAQAFVFVVELTHPGFSAVLMLNRSLVLQGQVWRLVTYLFIPATTSPLWFLFAMYWLHLLGTSLEAQWGSFRYQAFWLIGMFLTTVVAFAFDIPASNVYLLMSLFLAFATLFPDFEIRVFLIIPVKVKWLALLDGLALLGMMGTANGLQKVVPLLAIGNYLLFFAGTLVERVRQGSSRAARSGAGRSFAQEGAPPVRAQRVCKVCGVTDDDREVEFRVCTCEKCGGKPTDFCIAHARNH
jgi:membrane associated rhomboid family serine protease